MNELIFAWIFLAVMAVCFIWFVYTEGDCPKCKSKNTFEWTTHSVCLDCKHKFLK